MSRFITTCGLCPIPFNLGTDACAIARNIDEIAKRAYIETVIMAHEREGRYSRYAAQRDQIIELERSEMREELESEMMQLADDGPDFLGPSTFLETKTRTGVEKTPTAIEMALEQLRRGAADRLRYTIRRGMLASLDISWETRHVEKLAETRHSLNAVLGDRMTAIIPGEGISAIDNPQVQWFMTSDSGNGFSPTTAIPATPPPTSSPTVRPASLRSRSLRAI